ncbi:uncharacterized protein N7469_004630 [Penicillium citrinum]|uniref:Uncharacterized protein n=1 Tax=Penicillium citrinum TaxID=5077 RepID=A0A9W9TQZ3_PENCI|nr:uncharacterized protein N7469_004630 [Penicillium citrinum]KAJ5235462.1 hypothetical protein N7469_004630 [Penicillium citrinum]
MSRAGQNAKQANSALLYAGSKKRRLTGPLLKPDRARLKRHSIFMILKCIQSERIYFYMGTSSTYDHRVWRTGLPVRSAVLKPHTKRGQ